MKKILTWIVVADHQHARLFVNDGPGHGIKPVETFDADQQIPRSRDLMSDGEGRGFSGADGRRHGMQARVDPHRQEGEKFLTHLVDRLSQASAHNAFERLIIVAPPRALGEIRKHLPQTLQSKIIGELDNDLTKSTPQAIREHLESYLVP